MRSVADRLGWLAGVVQDWLAGELRVLADARGRFADAVSAVPPPLHDRR